MSENNPFEPPKAELMDVGKVERPVWVWVIFIFYLLSALSLMLSFAIIFSGRLPMSETTRQYFANINALEYLLTFVITVTNVVAAVQLFRLRRVSQYLFPAALFLGVLSWGLRLVLGHGFPAGAGLGQVVFGWVIALLVCLYTWRLARLGVLK
jgi:hypothetical protein